MVTPVNSDNFDSHFHDLKNVDDLVFQILADCKGDIKLIRNYTNNEINKMACKLILDDILKGGIVNGKAAWRKLTLKGEVIYKQMKRENEENFS